ncbi:MAG: ABC transporter permease [Thermoleophilaceae bacterium]
MTAVVRAFVRRDLAITRSYRLALAAQAAATLLALFVAFHVSKLIEPRGFEDAAGIDTSYFSWVVIGLAMLRMVHAAAATPPMKLREEQTMGTFEALVATPTSPEVLLLAGAVYEVTLAFVQGVVVLLIAALFFHFQLNAGALDVLAALVAAVGTVGCFLAVGMMLAALGVVVKRIGTVATMVPTIVAVLGGVYFPIALMPGALHTLAKLLPINWGLDVMRHALLDGSVPAGELAAVVATAVAGMLVSVVALRVAVDRARSAGTLAHY